MPIWGDSTLRDGHSVWVAKVGSAALRMLPDRNGLLITHAGVDPTGRVCANYRKRCSIPLRCPGRGPGVPAGVASTDTVAVAPWSSVTVSVTGVVPATP